MTAPTTIAELFRAHVGNDRIALRFEDASWTHREVLDAISRKDVPPWPLGSLMSSPNWAAGTAVGSARRDH